MSTLPPLDTDSAGLTVFYNVIGQGGLAQSQLTWGDVVDNPNIASYDVADNGLLIEYDGGPNQRFTIRVKTDGWVVAYQDADFPVEASDSGGDPQHRDWNISDRVGDSQGILTAMKGEWTGGGDSWEWGPYVDGLNDAHIIKAIEDIMSDLSDWGQANYSPSDVGWYDFNFGSDGISYFTEADGSSRETFDVTNSISVLSGTTVNQAVAAAFTQGYHYHYFKIAGGSVHGESSKGSELTATDITTEMVNNSPLNLRFQAKTVGGLCAVVTVKWSET